MPTAGGYPFDIGNVGPNPLDFSAVMGSLLDIFPNAPRDATGQPTLEARQLFLQMLQQQAQANVAARNQAFQEQTLLSQLAANPRNLIQSALMQGSRTPVTAPRDVLQTEAPGGAPPGQQNFAAVLGNLPGDTRLGAPATQGQAAGLQQGSVDHRWVGRRGDVRVDPSRQGAAAQPTNLPTSIGQQQVPFAAVVEALRNRRRVPTFGAIPGAQGRSVTLDQLQTDPNLQLRLRDLDLASARNALQNPEEAAFIESTLSAQGRDPATFLTALSQSLRGQQGGRVRRAFF